MSSNIGKHATSIYKDSSEYTCVRYHDTDVVCFNSTYIILNTGGFWTPTTKRRMNEVSCKFGLGFHVFQRKFKWFINMPNGKTKEFIWETESFLRC